jgi:alkylation response protein AidB-like acyl-CoA dehydrogenase
MRFAFTREQHESAHAIRGLLEKECPPEVVRSPHDPRVWKQLAEMGVIGLRRDQDEIDLVLLLEEAGRALVPGPLLATAAVGIPALVDAGESRWVERASAGDAVIAIGLGGEAVAFAEVADLFLLEADRGLHAVARDHVELEPAPGFSTARPSFHVRWQPADATRLDTSVELAFDRAAFGAAAELLGVAARLIEMAAQYAKDRRQFGVPIGSFQAVKHLLANALIRLEFARPAVYRAAYSLAREAPMRSRDVSMAKALASDAGMLAARNALQVHGAIGYTEDHDLHLWLKAAWALALAYGDAAWHRERVAAAIL